MKRSFIPFVVLAFIFTSYTGYALGDALFQFRPVEEMKTITRIEKKQSTDDRELYSLVIEGSRAKEVFVLLKKYDGETERYGATDVDTKVGENVVCINALQRYGFKSEEERDTYKCWFKFGTEVGLAR